MKFTILVTGLLSVLMAAPAASAAAETGPAGATFSSASGRAGALPTEFPLPGGFAPEGIAIGPGPVAYISSRESGAIYRADLLTGRGGVINPGPGTPSLGLKLDGRGRLFVAGGAGGDARVIDAFSGRLLATYRLSTEPAFVNDVVLLHDAAYFTDSIRPVLYKLPLRTDGQLPSEVVTVPLSGDIVYTTGSGADGINANGIAPTPDGQALLIVQSSTGKLFRVAPSTGVATQVDLGADSLLYGDGLLLRGRTLYAVQNYLNTLTSVRLSADGRSGQVVRRLTDSRFDIPTTVDSYGSRLYLPNGRFTVPPTPTTPYSVIAVNS
ncbi:superoxide dismutase [Microbispora sp. NPDC049125]|uniref:superoxide dismutase n=1 Tax=Microbispora sp. NPDC049125 TaxID=3154929 RepID=UPI0034673251